jgi:hypothetical protein
MGESLGQMSQLLLTVGSMKRHNSKDALHISKSGPARLAYIWQKGVLRIEITADAAKKEDNDYHLHHHDLLSEIA